MPLRADGILGKCNRWPCLETDSTALALQQLQQLQTLNGTRTLWGGSGPQAPSELSWAVVGWAAAGG